MHFMTEMPTTLVTSPGCFKRLLGSNLLNCTGLTITVPPGEYSTNPAEAITHLSRQRLTGGVSHLGPDLSKH